MLRSKDSEKIKSKPNDKEKDVYDLKVTLSPYLSTIYLQTLIFDFISFVILFVLHPIDGTLIALLALFVALLGRTFQAVLA